MIFSKAYDGFNVGMKWLLAIMMAAITILTFYQVFMRYVLNMAPSWSEELVRFIFVWLSFIGAAVGAKEGIHIGIDVLYRSLPALPRRTVAGFISLIVAVFGLAMIIYGWDVVVMTHPQLSPALGLHMSTVYAAVPVMGCLLILYTGVTFARHFKDRN